MRDHSKFEVHERLRGTWTAARRPNHRRRRGGGVDGGNGCGAAHASHDASRRHGRATLHVQGQLRLAGRVGAHLCLADFKKRRTHRHCREAHVDRSGARVTVAQAGACHVYGSNDLRTMRAGGGVRDRCEPRRVGLHLLRCLRPDRRHAAAALQASKADAGACAVERHERFRPSSAGQPFVGARRRLINHLSL